MGRKLKNTIYGLCAVTAAMHVCNRLVFKYSIRRGILDIGDGQYFETRFGKMFYTVSGEGKPLLLIHNLSSVSSGYEWNKVLNNLSSKYKVYVVDLIGCGRSDKPEISYTAYIYVKILKEFISSVIGEKVDIVCTGKAFDFVTMIKATYKDMVGKTIAISPKPIINASFGKISDKRYIVKKIEECPVLGTFIYNIFMSKNIIEEKFEEEYFYDKKLISSRAINAYYESSHLSGASSRFLFASLENNYLYVDITKSISEYGMSECMIIMGEEYEKSDEIKKQYSSLNSMILYKVLQETNELPQLEKPVDISDIIMSFFG